MKRLNQILDLQFEALHKKNWDNVIVITGREGTGKSELALHILEYWVRKKYSKCTSEDIKYINLDIAKWGNSLANCKKGDMNILDEAGELAGRRAMSQLNFVVIRAFQIIRGDNLNLVLVLPSLFWLDGELTKQRAKLLIYVSDRGRFTMWPQKDIKKIIDINSRRVVKNVHCGVKGWPDTFPIYKGELKEPYGKLKAEYMKDIRKELAESINKLKGGKDGKPDARIKLIENMKEKGLSQSKIAELMGVSGACVSKLLKAHQEGSQF